MVDLTSSTSLSTARRHGILNRMADSASRTFGLPRLMANPPTITGPNDDNSFGIDARTFEIEWGYADRYTFLGGDWEVMGVNFPLYLGWWNIPAHKGDGVNVDAVQQEGFGRVRFMSSAPKIDLRFRWNGGARIMVNGEYIELGNRARIGDTVGGNNFALKTLTWGDGSDAFAEPRCYEIVMEAGQGWCGAIVEKKYNVTPWPEASKLRVALLSDSMAATTVDSVTTQSDAPQPILTDVVGLALGVSDIQQVAIGGACYLFKDNKSNLAEVLENDILGRDIDVLLEFGGRNSSDFDLMTDAEFEAYYENEIIRKTLLAHPHAIIIAVTALPSGEQHSNSTTFNRLAAIKQNVIAKYPKSAVFIDSGPWFKGSGNQTAPAGNGLADYYVGGDTVHYTSEGNISVGLIAAQEIRGAVAKLIAAQ